MKSSFLVLTLLTMSLCRVGGAERPFYADRFTLWTDCAFDAPSTALFGLPVTADSEFAELNHTGLYERRIVVQRFAPSQASVPLRAFEPAVRVWFTEDICQPDNAFYAYHE